MEAGELHLKHRWCCQQLVEHVPCVTHIKDDEWSYDDVTAGQRQSFKKISLKWELELHVNTFETEDCSTASLEHLTVDQSIGPLTSAFLEIYTQITNELFVYVFI